MDPGQLTIGVVGRQDKMKLGQSVRGVGHTVADSRHCDSNSRAKSDCRTLWRQPGRPSGDLSISSFSQAASPSAKMPGSRRSHEFKVLPGAWAIIERSEVEVLEKQCELLSLILPALGKSLTGTMVGDVQARVRTHLSLVGRCRASSGYLRPEREVCDGFNVAASHLDDFEARILVSGSPESRYAH